jgi:hypothetical protein
VSALSFEMEFRDELRTTRKLQLAQPSPGSIELRIVPFRGVDRDALAAELVRRSEEAFGANATLTVEFVDEIAPTPAGKLRRVV